MESWRVVLTPVFHDRRYPGQFWRVLNGICAIQARSNGNLTVYLGAHGLAKRTGVDLKSCKRVLRRLEADGVLQLVEQGRPGRFKEADKPGAPGIAHGYQLGRLCYPEIGGKAAPIQEEPKGGKAAPIRPVEKPAERGQVYPLSKGGKAAPPTSSSGAIAPSSDSWEEGMPKGRRTGGSRRRARISPDDLQVPSATTPPGLRALLGGDPQPGGGSGMTPVSEVLGSVLKGG